MDKIAHIFRAYLHGSDGRLCRGEVWMLRVLSLVTAILISVTVIVRCGGGWKAVSGGYGRVSDQ